jgi:hypothetical protein
MKYILLEESEDSILFEYGGCRALKSFKPLHLCISGFTDGLPRPPTKIEIDTIVEKFFIDDNDAIIPNFKVKMFSENLVHVWEDNSFTRQVCKGVNKF